MINQNDGVLMTITTDGIIYSIRDQAIYRRISSLLNSRRRQKTSPNNYKRWSPEEEEMLKKLFSEGNDVKTIAEVLERTRMSINVRLSKLGLMEDKKFFPTKTVEL